MDLSWFNQEDYEPLQDFEAIPEGKYPVVITASEEKLTKDGKGTMLVLTFQVIEGKYKGRNLWSRLNIKNNSEQAQSIALRTLGAITRAVGVPNAKDSIELHSKPLLVKVVLSQYGDRVTNEIRGYFDIKGQGDVANPDNKTPQPQGATESKSDTPPWEK